MRSLTGLLLVALASVALSTAAKAQLAVPPIGTTPRPGLEPRVTVRTAYLDATDRTMTINAMIFNASDTPARNVVVECEFWVSHQQRYALKRVVKERPIPPRLGLQFAIDYGPPLSEPPYATTCGVVKAELD
jgi:hypothetical protein